MIELTEQQVDALESSGSIAPRLVNPRTRETFVLVRLDEYDRLKECDDSPWTREELEALAWEAGERPGREQDSEGYDEPETPGATGSVLRTREIEIART